MKSSVVTWQKPAAGVWCLRCSWQTGMILVTAGGDWVSVTIIQLLVSSAPSQLCSTFILVFANICDKSFAFFLRLPSSWHVTFVKKYGMERKQKLDWVVTRRAGTGSGSGLRRVGGSLQLRVLGSSLAAATRLTQPRLVSQHSPGQENNKRLVRLIQRGVMWSNVNNKSCFVWSKLKRKA